MSCSSPTLSKKYFRSMKICILTRFEAHTNRFLRAVFMSINTLMSFGMVSVLKIQSYQCEVQSILGKFRSKIVVFRRYSRLLLEHITTQSVTSNPSQKIETQFTIISTIYNVIIYSQFDDNVFVRIPKSSNIPESPFINLVSPRLALSSRVSLPCQTVRGSQQLRILVKRLFHKCLNRCCSMPFVYIPAHDHKLPLRCTGSETLP